MGWLWDLLGTEVDRFKEERDRHGASGGWLGFEHSHSPSGWSIFSDRCSCGATRDRGGEWVDP